MQREFIRAPGATAFSTPAHMDSDRPADNILTTEPAPRMSSTISVRGRILLRARRARHTKPPARCTPTVLCASSTAERHGVRVARRDLRGQGTCAAIRRSSKFTKNDGNFSRRGARKEPVRRVRYRAFDRLSTPGCSTWRIATNQRSRFDRRRRQFFPPPLGPGSNPQASGTPGWLFHDPDQNIWRAHGTAVRQINSTRRQRAGSTEASAKAPPVSVRRISPRP